MAVADATLDKAMAVRTTMQSRNQRLSLMHNQWHDLAPTGAEIVLVVVMVKAVVVISRHPMMQRRTQLHRNSSQRLVSNPQRDNV